MAKMRTDIGQDIRDLPIAEATGGHEVVERLAGNGHRTAQTVKQHSDEDGFIAGHPLGTDDRRVNAWEAVAGGLMAIEAKMFVDPFARVLGCRRGRHGGEQ